MLFVAGAVCAIAAAALILPRTFNYFAHANRLRLAYAEVHKVHESLGALSEKQCDDLAPSQWRYVCHFMSNCAGNMFDPGNPPLEDLRRLRVDLEVLVNRPPSRQLAIAIWERLRITNPYATRFITRFDAHFRYLLGLQSPQNERPDEVADDGGAAGDRVP